MSRCVPALVVAVLLASLSFAGDDQADRTDAPSPDQQLPPRIHVALDTDSEESPEAPEPEESPYNKKIKVGDVAPAFEAPTLDGATLKLADYRGKIVLLDFWASWCGPCIAEMPNVIAAYEKFHDKGFEVLGISLDDARTDLEEFLAEHPGMKWPQVFDGKAWESDVSVLYGVEAIPFTLLLDREGNVVARDLRGEQLETAILEQLGE